MRRFLLGLALLAGGCRQILGFDTPLVTDGGKPGDDTATGETTLTLATASTQVGQTRDVNVGFTVTYASDVAGPLTVHVDGLPPEVTAGDVSLGPGATTGTIRITAAIEAVQLAMANATVSLRDGNVTLATQPLMVTVVGAPGGLDTTFGTGGIGTVTVTNGTVVNAATVDMAVVPASASDAGKLVVIGDIGTTALVVVRFTAVGAIDPSFGDGTGYVVVQRPATGTFSPAAVAVDSKGRIVVLARLDCHMVLLRLTAAGAPDATFTTFNGYPLVGPPITGSCGQPTSVAVLPDDKIETLSLWNLTAGSQRALLARFNSNGTQDMTAYSTGPAISLTPPDTTRPSWYPSKLIIDDQQREVFAGVNCAGGWNTTVSACQSAVGRVSSAGVWDTTFGNGGAAVADFGATGDPNNRESFRGVTMTPGGEIVAVGHDEGFQHGTIARFAANGTVISAITSTTVVGTSAQLEDVVIDANGNVLATGYANFPIATRYTSAGVVDATFGQLGLATLPGVSIPHGLALQADGRFIVAGSTPRAGGGSNVAVWRFWP